VPSRSSRLTRESAIVAMIAQDTNSVVPSSGYLVWGGRGRVKHDRRVATRYDKTDPDYFGSVCLASLMTTIL
jgi:hypothetical protein